MRDKSDPEENSYWLDKPGNVSRILYGLFIACALSGLLDLFLPRKSVFWPASWFDTWPGFFAGYGFFACVGLVLAAKLLRRLLMRSEEYYD